jgi:hypothetical protein
MLCPSHPINLITLIISEINTNMALITLHSSPASGFFSLGPNAFRRTAEVNDNLKAMVITNKPIKAAGTM